MLNGKLLSLSIWKKTYADIMIRWSAVASYFENLFGARYVYKVLRIDTKDSRLKILRVYKNIFESIFLRMSFKILLSS